MNSYWYVLHSQANKEESLRRQLELKEIDYYYPTLRVKPVNPRSRKIRPYFPGYIFVSLDLELQNPSDIQWMPYSAGLVSFGGEPARVPENLIQALKKKLISIDNESSESEEGLNAGEKIIIRGGPFDGFEGIFQSHLSGKERVRILLSMLSSRNIPMDLPEGQVYRKK